MSTLLSRDSTPENDQARMRSNIRSRELASGTLFVDPAGRFTLDANRNALIDCAEGDPSLAKLAGAYLDERRRAISQDLDYLILVPTLRCNLACSYCQVSRAAQSASGYDWTDETTAAVTRLIGNLDARAIKVEFQGGEPTLRPDLLQAVIDAVPSHIDATFVVCTNLQELSNDILAIFDRDDVTISTSLDGPLDIHARQRGRSEATTRFATNLAFVLNRYGSNKVSALPTIDPLSPPPPEALVAAFEGFGFSSIYLRPINYQGFARKNHQDSREIGAQWSAYHRHFIAHLIEHNWASETSVEETYFSMILRRIFRPGADRHVDLRNPNPVGRDYNVIDHDGVTYPTDEARMLARAGVIDLSIGTVEDGWDTPARAALEAVATLDGDPDCERCVYKPYCGRDVFDDLSRYGTIELPRHETEFCRRHLALFDLAFELLHSDDPKVRHSLGQWLQLPGALPSMVAAL